MQLHTNVIEFPLPADTDDDEPHFCAWRWGRGALSISVEGFDEFADGETLLTFSPEVGVEIGEPTVLALSGEPSLLLFKGTFDHHRDTIFDQWNKLAVENERPAIWQRNRCTAASTQRRCTTIAPRADWLWQLCRNLGSESRNRRDEK